MKYTQNQIGEKKIRKINNRTRDTYCLYVWQGDLHEEVIINGSWGECRDKTKELIELGVSELDIYAESRPDARDWGQARKHLILPTQ